MRAMPTREQVITIQTARRALNLSEAAYRMLLKNVAKVESSKQLDNRGIEDVMAVFEDMGFDRHPGGRTYWRDKVANRSSKVNERQIRLIEMLSQGGRYCLPALVERFSAGRTASVIELTPGEAWKLTEMLKSAKQRDMSDITLCDGSAGKH